MRSSVAEGLAWEASSEDIHLSTKLSEREFFKVREHRARIQEARFHLRNQVCGCEGFDLHMSDFSHIWENSSESNSDPFVSTTKGEVSDMFFGIIHIHLLSFFLCFLFLFPRIFVLDTDDYFLFCILFSKVLCAPHRAQIMMFSINQTRLIRIHSKIDSVVWQRFTFHCCLV